MQHVERIFEGRYRHAPRAALLLVVAGLASTLARASDLPAETHTVASADGVRIVYDVRGRGDTALIFLHCWACNRHFWRFQADAFASQYRVVTVDLAGHGDSGRNRRQWTILGSAQDVVAVANDLHLQRIVLIGHSMGGWVALETARQLHGRVVGVVLVDIMHDVADRRSVAAAEAQAGLLRKDFQGYFSNLSPMFSKGAAPSIRDWIEHQAMSAYPPAVIALALNAPDIDAKQLFSRAGVPIRAINAKPPLSPATDVAENRKYADYAVTFVGDSGHFIQLERPLEFNRDLAAWLRYFSGIPQKAP